jgi:sec-independent protein translocase protein TatA
MAEMFGTILFISGQEIIFAVLIALLLFGSKEIPKLARTFGKGMKEFKRATEDIKREFETASPEVMDDFKDIKNNLTKDATEIKKNLTKDADDIVKNVKDNLDAS